MNSTDTNTAPSKEPQTKEKSADSGDSFHRIVKYYFFRDIDECGNCKKPTSPNRECYEQAAGIVLERYSTNSASLKDLAVQFVDPFTGTVDCAWRGDGEIELYEVDEFEWVALRDRMNEIEALDQT